ncbi:hypothetical protein VTO42DRAFT_4354 [Malbranchea cinnamomea]
MQDYILRVRVFTMDNRPASGAQASGSKRFATFSKCVENCHDHCKTDQEGRPMPLPETSLDLSAVMMLRSEWPLSSPIPVCYPAAGGDCRVWRNT